MEKEQVHDVVKSGYAKVARQGGGCCGPTTEQATSCCGSTATDPHAETAALIGYSEVKPSSTWAPERDSTRCSPPRSLARKAGSSAST